MSALIRMDDRGLRDLVHGAGWAGLDDDTKELLRQRDAEVKASKRRRPVTYLRGQIGCPKVLA